MATASLPSLITAEEFAERPDPGYPEELVDGRIVRMPPPDKIHGFVCGEAYFAIRTFVAARELGRVMTNDTGVLTRRNPDTLRGADVAFYSYNRLPRGPIPPGVTPEIPELIVEVRSASDRWRDVIEKVTEYLNAGVLAVVVLDPEPQTAHVFTPDLPPRALTAEAELTLPGVLDGFAVNVGRFFQ